VTAVRPHVRVAVVGGSLGGLTAALVLRDAGCDVDVYERSSTPLEGRGAGIVLHPATVRYLSDRSSGAVERISTRADRLVYLNRDGGTAHEEPCRYRFTSYYALYHGLLECLEPARYHLGRGVEGLEQSAVAATVRMSDGATTVADLVVFADGIHSTGRALLLPTITPSYAGYVGWRGTVEAADLSRRAWAVLHGAIVYFVGRGTHILCYPIPDIDGNASSTPRINFVWYRNVPQGHEFEDLMTGRDGLRRPASVGPGMVAQHHVDDLFDAARAELPPVISETVIASREPFLQAVLDVAVPRMVFGRACIIGDAAFALRPHAAAGTAKAAEDAWKLAACMRAAGHDPITALSRWEPDQLELGRRVQARARDIGTRSQFLGTFRPPDPYLAFGLYEPGDSWMAPLVGS
jgi:2,6-dihydroxypyridine 3-monooxygenase